MGNYRWVTTFYANAGTLKYNDNTNRKGKDFFTGP